MAWSTPHVWSVGEVLTAANMNTYLSDNTTYLKSQTDLFNLAVYNNGSTTLNVGDVVILDTAYTSGLGVTLASGVSDPRVIGTVIGSAISGSASGLIWAPGFMKQTVNVTGAVTFGHSLVTAAGGHYAQDSGGGGASYGMLGWALAASTGGTASINALIRVNPQYYTFATTVTRTSSGVVTSNSTATVVSGAVSDGSNRCMVLFSFNNAVINGAKFNGSGFTSLQDGAAGKPYAGYLLPSAATADVQANYPTNNGLEGYVFLNGVNQTAPVGSSLGTGTATSSNGSVVVSCSPGDIVFACICSASTYTWRIIS
jgi:hypothetical protein